MATPSTPPSNVVDLKEKRIEKNLEGMNDLSLMDHQGNVIPREQFLNALHQKEEPVVYVVKRDTHGFLGQKPHNLLTDGVLNLDSGIAVFLEPFGEDFAKRIEEVLPGRAFYYDPHDKTDLSNPAAWM